jgi:hypothetical protein
METENKTKDSNLFNSILNIVKKLELKESVDDSYDHRSIAREIESHLIQNSTEKLSPEEMASKRLELVRGKNIELWVDGEQTEYWKEIYMMGVSDERNNFIN